MQQLTERYLAARRRIIEASFSGMNEAQRQAVLAPDAPLLILAGAGSGKTTVLVNRIVCLLKFGNLYGSTVVPEALTEVQVDLLEEYAACSDPEAEQAVLQVMGARPVQPWAILAVTFTNKAAHELKERLVREVGPEGTEVVAGTFHAICGRILRRHIEVLGYPRNFTIYDTDDCKRVVKEVVRDLKLEDSKFPPAQMLGLIGRAKDALMGPMEYEAEYRDDFRASRVARIYSEYQRRLKAAGALDFDDMIRLTVLLLQRRPEVLEFYQRRFSYVCVDEYQDTNHAQFVLTELLAGEGVILVVGDDDQSIYKFRGATIENILSFENRHRDATVLRLEQNYRSTATILDCANSTIQNNLGRKGKRLWTQNNRGGPVLLYQGEDSYEEAQFIADRIVETSAAEQRPFSDFAVLYRTNAQSSAIEEALLKSGLPYRIFGGMKFYERKEIKDLVAYLSLLVNPADELRVKRILNEPKRGIGDVTVAQLEQAATAWGIPLLAAIGRAGEIPALVRQVERLRLFTELMDELTQLAGFLPPSELLEQLLDKTGYLELLKTLDAADGRDRLANVDTLADNMRNYERGEQLPTLTGFLESAALATDLDNLDEQAGSVSLMTMHAAKGLEFPVVFVSGMEEELFPSARSLFDPDELEEERRLFYVAITRAKRQLYLTASKMRRTYNMTRYPELSRFVGELPGELLDNRSPKRAPPACAAQPERGNLRPSYEKKLAAALAPSGEAATRRQAEVPIYHAGDRVTHKKFGHGNVLSVTPSGGDQLLEIAFDQVGTKRLMANFAAAMLSRKD